MARKQQPYAELQVPSAEKLLEQHAPLVKRIAHHLVARLPESVQVDDLIQAGLEGLLEAANNFSAGKGASFETYAGIRIRGAMLDEIRRGDWSPRSVHRNARGMAEAYQAVAMQMSREPSAREVAAYMGITLDEYHQMSRQSLGARLTSFDEVSGDDSGTSRGERVAAADAGPEQAMQADQQRARLAAAIAELPERDQLLLSLYYQQELNLKEIGKVLGVSESRVSQLHAQAAVKLRAKLLDS
ncbi:MAG: RNA polymerase sigma factor FliA [Pseudomonadales bacterium]|nr:RNA polymerase sigma factor FliA [Pseudomonadales bacterium]